MSVLRSPIPPCSETNENTISVCIICNLIMKETQDCLFISQCNHSFHRHCIENFLSQSSECPTCKRPCELSELRVVNAQVNSTDIINLNSEDNQQLVAHSLALDSQNLPSGTQKPKRGGYRGAKSRQYNTRSSVRNFFPEHNDSHQSNISMPGNMNNEQTDRSQAPPPISDSIRNHNDIYNSPMVNRREHEVQMSNQIDYAQLNHVIEATREPKCWLKLFA